MSPSSVSLVAGVLAALVLSGCGDDGAPTVEIVDASPTQLDPSNDTQDDLTIVVRYVDEDGDLGGGVAEVHDCRAAGVVSRLSLPEIASAEAVEEAVQIEGQLSLVVSDVGEVAPGALPEACEAANAFCVVLVDSAGNASEAACTSAISITPSAG
jgi:hypothetical protein